MCIRDVVDDYRNSDDTNRKKKIGFFVSQVMKATQGKANPQQVNQLLKELALIHI